MKNYLNQALLSTMLVTGVFTAEAQQVPAQLPPPNRADRGPGKPMAPGEKRPIEPGEKMRGPRMQDNEITKLTVLSGTVNKQIANDRYEYNGFSLTTGSGNVTVTYPPHLGEKIYSLAKVGTTAKVTGFYRTNPQGANEFHFVTLEINGTVVTDTPPVPPTSVAAQQQTNLNATIKELRYTPNKEVNGFILSSGEMVGIPPHIAQQLGTQLKVGEKVGVTGFVESKRPGVVYSQNVAMIKAQTLTINNQAYLIR